MNNQLSEQEMLESVDNMCAESLSPELYEKWEEVSAMLRNNRKAFRKQDEPESAFEICNVCSGSGEGPADRTTCWNCGGKGEVRINKIERDEP